MPHAIYQTPALVLSVTAMKESNKLAVLYTRDFGLVYVAAQSVRELSSKMKSQLHSYSFVEVDLVRGRDIWRLTGIHEKYHVLKYVGSKWYPFMTKVAGTIKRLCPGEEPHEGIWNDIEKLEEIISQGSTAVTSHELEIIILARLLYHLGYWSGHETLVEADNCIDLEVLAYLKKHQTSLIVDINEGLQGSQL